MLCLDNSSTMALVQLELLHQIEKATGKKITELFQWIVASGIGGLLMLVMVYGTYICISCSISMRSSDLSRILQWRGCILGIFLCIP